MAELLDPKPHPCGRGNLVRKTGSFCVCRIDPYGFERPEDFDYEAYEEFFSTYLVILTKRAIKWSKLLKRSGGVRKSLTVKRYVRKGIPLEHRARVWMAMSGAQAQMDQNPGYYQRLLEGEGSPSLEEAIRTDLNRTFPDNVRFRKTAEPCLQKTLYNVLLAYGLHNQDYYSPAMLGLKTDQEVLAELVRMKLPAVAALMDGHGVLWTLLVSRWFICLFVDILPVETVLRIWDCLFNEGSKIIFRVALTLIKQHQEFILEAKSVPDICDKFKQITKGDFVTECHTFMQKWTLQLGWKGPCPLDAHCSVNRLFSRLTFQNTHAHVPQWTQHSLAGHH
ncbi:GH regulated TBC protein 1 [Cricetulus griseus]